MVTKQNQGNLAEGPYAIAPTRRYSKMVKVTSRTSSREPGEVETVVEIFCHAGSWYCQVCRGRERTRPMGPYTKQQAEQIQDARRRLIAKLGSARLMFERSWSG